MFRYPKYFVKTHQQHLNIIIVALLEATRYNRFNNTPLIRVAVGVSYMADKRRFLVRFWGVRGSYPTPGPGTVRHGGNTSCIEVQAGSHTLILDAGSGLIRLGEDLLRRTKGKPLYLSLLITHVHGDHLIGFPFFAPLFDGHTDIDFFGPSLAGRSIEQLVTPI